MYKRQDKGFGSTGSADFQKIWTYLGLPSISLPLLTGENDLPLGLQLVGNKFDDLRFLGTAKWLEDNCKDEWQNFKNSRVFFSYNIFSRFGYHINKISYDRLSRRIASIYCNDTCNRYDVV